MYIYTYTLYIHTCIHIFTLYLCYIKASREDNVRVLVKEMLSVLLECFSELSRGKDKLHPKMVREI